VISVLVDLDGTITDPAPGIIAAVRHAIAAMGRTPPPADALRWVIGPPLRETFPHLLGPGADVERALSYYRDHYGAGGLFDAVLVPGMAEALAALASDGRVLFVCTSKPHPYARRIIEHFGLSGYFRHIYGPELDGTHDDKGDLIAHIIAQEGIHPSRTVMVGDRLHDVRGAKHNGIATIGVLWGYGDRAELETAGAAAIIDRPQMLHDTVRRLLHQ
jgi:phosphoglycolate phosphatase